MAAWIARLTLAVVMLSHGITKWTRTESFMSKFGLSEPVSVLAGLAEVGGTLVILAGGVLLYQHRYHVRTTGIVLSLLGVAGIATVQIGAIATVHDGWWYYANPPGVEYNVVLLALCAIVAVVSVHRQPEEVGRD